MRQFPFLRGLVETLAFAALVPALWGLFWSLNNFTPMLVVEARIFFRNYWVFLNGTLRVAVERDPFLFLVLATTIFVVIVPVARNKLGNWLSTNKLRTCWIVVAVVMSYNITQQSGILEKMISGAAAALFLWLALSERHRASIAWRLFIARRFIRESFRR